MIRRLWIGLLLSGFLAYPDFAFAQDDTEALAKEVQNPVAALISVPFQNNLNFGVGPDNELGYTLNIQPVVPFKLSPDWNVVSRTIVPLTYSPIIAPDVGNVFGLGDIQEQVYFTPAKSGSFIWGVGPVIQAPSATDMALGSGKWAAGPGGVLVFNRGPWVFGGLLNNIWSFGGDDDRSDFSLMTLQPFLNYNLPGGWYVTTGPAITANWDADSGQRWTVPVGGGVGKIFRIGAQPLNAQLAAYYNAVRPDGGADWQLRFQIQLLFPK